VTGPKETAYDEADRHGIEQIEKVRRAMNPSPQFMAFTIRGAR